MKYRYDSRTKDKDAELIIATYAVANELAELNQFLRKDKTKEDRDALDAIEREFGVEV